MEAEYTLTTLARPLLGALPAPPSSLLRELLAKYRLIDQRSKRVKACSRHLFSNRAIVETSEWGKAMRIIGLVMLLAVSAFTQVPPAVTAACGPQKVSFNVKLDESQHALAELEPGKAQVLHSGKGRGFIRRDNHDRVGRSMGRRKQEQFLFHCVCSAGRAPCVCTGAVPAGASAGVRAFHGGRGAGLLRQLASHLRRTGGGELVSWRGRQRPGQIPDCLLSAERFNSQKVTYVL